MDKRKCPVCGSPIGSYTTRAYVTCGKPECILENQRESSRKWWQEHKDLHKVNKQ